MSNTYTTSTGVLHFNGRAIITPVIRAFFTPLDFDESEPGDESMAYIAEVAESTEWTWSAIVDSIAEFSSELGIEEPADVQGVVQGEPSGIAGAWLLALLNRFEVCEQRLRSIVMTGPFNDYDSPNMALVFDLVMACADGHNLIGLELKGSWCSDRPELGGFGGFGIYRGKHVGMEIGSNDIALIEEADRLLAQQDEEGAAEILGRLVTAVAASVVNDGVRTRIAKRLQATLAAFADNQEI